jgi:hypothetical protein
MLRVCRMEGSVQWLQQSHARRRVYVCNSATPPLGTHSTVNYQVLSGDCPDEFCLDQSISVHLDASGRKERGLI